MSEQAFPYLWVWARESPLPVSELKAGLHGMRYAPNNRRARGTRERRPAVKKIITVAKNRNEIFKQQQLTIGVDVGDRISLYCILDETGNVILEQRGPTTPKGIQQVFDKISRLNERIAEYDRRIEQIAKEVYPEGALLKQVKRVGTL